MNENLIQRYQKLRSAQEEITLKRAAAVARLEDAEVFLREQVTEIQSHGFTTLDDLRKAITDAETKLEALLTKAEKQLEEGGFA